jgi:hypothetical protein
MFETASPVASSPAETPTAAVRTLAQELIRLVDVARVLVDSDRVVDLAGLDHQVGLLCAKTLDLPPDEGRRMRPRMIALLGSVEGLSRAFAAHGPRSG